MRNSILGFGIVILTFLIACDKSDNDKPDNIIFKEIKKTVSVSKIDSINGICKAVVFGISGNNSDGFKAYITSNPMRVYCDAASQFLVHENTNQILLLKRNSAVSENGTWKSNAEMLYLDQFSGQGENFIGYRAVSFPGGTPIYYYGWIKIELSPKNETLKIFSRADNQTEFNAIKTGQVEY